MDGNIFVAAFHTAASKSPVHKQHSILDKKSQIGSDFIYSK